jgi:hypothetical protein
MGGRLGGGSDKRDSDEFKIKTGPASIAGKSAGCASPETVLEENWETNRKKRLIRRLIAWDGNGYDPDTAWIKAKAKAIVELDDNC